MLLNSVICCLSSGILLALGTPSIGIWQLSFISFISFIPLLFAVENQFYHGKASFCRMFFIGFLFSYLYAVSCFYWITNMSWVAMFVIAAIYALIYGLFAPGIALALKIGLGRTALSLWTVFLWVSLEVVLSDIFLPIPSMAVGYLVWPLSSMIQVADLTGAFGVSFWVIIVNVLIFSLLKDGLKKSVPFLGVTVLVTCFIAGYGFVKLPVKSDSSRASFSIDTVYTAILSKDKKDKDSRKKIFEILKQKTIQSINVSGHHPDLVVWPETSVPVFLRSVREKEFIKGLLDLTQNNKVPVLIGALSFQRSENRSIKKYNSAFLVPEQGFISQEYHKNILVPFTETNPFRKVLPKRFQKLCDSNFDAGKEPGLINLFNKIRFGVVICYEVFFPNFVRKAANKESGFLVNITNDHHAFDDLKAAYKIPLPHLVFRAVENRKFLVRSANWGYSMVISPQGKIIKSSSIGSTGYLSAMIIPNYGETFFSRHGFLFAKVFLFITLILAAWLFKSVLKSNK